MQERDNKLEDGGRDVTEATRGQSDPLHGTPYRFVRKLSDSGAMGEVVEAEQIALRKRVVIKLLRREYADSPGFVDRMRLEAEALGAVSPHPHVVTVLDLGRTPEGRAYLVMEKLVGRTLKEELAARGFIPVDEAVALVQQVLLGLTAAHGAGVVHRDVKPDNLFLCDPVRHERIVKILDFGIAKVVRELADGSGPSPLAPPTQQGLTVGTPRFLAPEQASGLPVDARADVYSVGAVLYTLVTGHDPFHHHRNLFNVLRAQVSEVPPLPSVGAPQAILEGVERAIMKALQKRPGDRWASAVELSAALESALRAPSPRWLTTEPVDVRAFQARGRARAALLPGPVDPSETATLELPAIGARFDPQPLPVAASSPVVPRPQERRPVSAPLPASPRVMVAALFALTACTALVAVVVHLLLVR